MPEEKPTVLTSPITVFFLGSGRLAVPVLKRLQECSSIDLLGTATQPDKPSGRQRRLQPTPVGEYGEQAGLPLLKPASVNAPEFLAVLHRLRPEIIITAAFGQIFKSDILQLPPFGCLNVHASLLPAHRGAAPIAASILAGDSVTGISFMHMDQGLDTGPVYTSRTLAIQPEETTPELEARLGALAAANIEAVMENICRRGLRPRPQDHRRATYAPRLTKQASRIDWSRPAEEIVRCIRAYQPWPGVAFTLAVEGRKSRRIKIIAARVAAVPEKTTPGTICRVNKKSFTIACGHNGIEVTDLIPEGSRPMQSSAFLRGTPIPEGIPITA